MHDHVNVHANTAFSFVNVAVVVDVRVRVDGRWGVHRSCSCSLCGRSEKVSDAMPTVEGAALPRILFHHGDT